MPIKPFKTIEQQKKMLLDRKLTIKDDKIFEEYIGKNNYFNVINGNEDLLLIESSKSNKYYDTATFDDFIRLHKFDKKLSKELLSIIHDFETHLKTSIAKNFCKHYCLVPKHTMQYTNNQNFRDIKDVEGSTYPLYNDQYKSIVNDYNSFKLFKNNFLKSLVENNDFIDANVFSVHSAGYSPPAGCGSYLFENGSRHGVVPLWVAIETLDFGTLQRLCHYLKPIVMNDVLHDFGLLPGEKFIFLNSLDVIKELRNKCAHFSLINRFYTPMDVKILPSLTNKLKLSPKIPGRKLYIDHLQKKVWKHPSKLSLYDSLKVLGMFESLARLKGPLDKIIKSNQELFKVNTYDLNHRLLTRMGESNYNYWKILLS